MLKINLYFQLLHIDNSRHNLSSIKEKGHAAADGVII